MHCSPLIQARRNIHLLEEHASKAIQNFLIVITPVMAAFDEVVLFVGIVLFLPIDVPVDISRVDAESRSLVFSD
jgi:hypothetical protein